MKSIRIIVLLAPAIGLLASCAGSKRSSSTQPARNLAAITPPCTLPATVVSPRHSGILSNRTLGRMFQFGIAVPIDYQLAMACYHRAVDAGDVEAMADIAFLYEYGLGVPQDYGQAMAWYLPAANAGDLSAMNEIGCLYAYGHGVAQDFAVAISWWKKAADECDVTSMYELGLVYDLGLAPATPDQVLPMIPDPGKIYHPNLKEAVKWYTRAAAMGDANAKKRLVELGYN
jgi:TPR repeat protein